MTYQDLNWQLKDLYEDYYTQSPVHYAQYSFSNLWTWKDSFPVKVNFDEKNNLCWSFMDGEVSGICGPIGNWNNINWQNALSEFKSGDEIYDVPEEVKNILSQDEFFKSKLSFEEEPGQNEYLYSVQELINLKGKNFAHKRNRLRAFLTGYEWDYYEITTNDFDDIMKFQEKWRVHRELNLTDKEKESLDEEDAAIKLTFKHWQDFKFLGGMLKINDEIIAYTIAEDLDGESLDVKFEKAYAEYSGSYQAINNLFMKNQCVNYKFANREEDLGEPGLREAKLSYNPIKLLKKYTIKFL